MKNFNLDKFKRDCYLHFATENSFHFINLKYCQTPEDDGISDITTFNENSKEERQKLLDLCLAETLQNNRFHTTTEKKYLEVYEAIKSKFNNDYPACKYEMFELIVEYKDMNLVSIIKEAMVHTFDDTKDTMLASLIYYHNVLFKDINNIDELLEYYNVKNEDLQILIKSFYITKVK